MGRIASIRRFLCLTAVGLVAASAVFAQDSQVRYPDTGLPILDCAPSAPAPTESCLLRLPPGVSFSDTDTDAMGETEGRFLLTRQGSETFPDDLQMSTTLLLVDLSPGLNGGRRETFETEKALLADFVRALPRGTELALYGFNESLQRITDFTTDRRAVEAAVENLELQGTNTRIATFVSDAVSILEERDDVLIKNIIVVSDGLEEGSRPMTEVHAQAVEAGVSISAIGTFWHPIGAPETGSGMDYLRDLAEGAGGGVQQVILRQTQEAPSAIQDFADSYGEALRNSALIVPDGPPQPSEISMRLSEPVLGNENERTSRRIAVTFQPETVPEPEPEPEPAPTLFGLPAFWVYVIGGVLAALILLAVVIAAMSRGAREDEADEDGFGDGSDGEDVIPGEEAGDVAPAPLPPARAYLVFAQDGRRAAVRGNRVNVGRSKSNEIVVDDESVSRLHAQIHLNRDGGFSVTDMDSLNGTEVDGEPIKGTKTVRMGEIIRFGTVEAKLTHT